MNEGNNALDNVFKSRIKQTFKKATYYSKYVFNDHLVLILMVLFGFLVIGYKEQLQILASNPTPLRVNLTRLIVAVVLSLLVKSGRPLWLTQAADQTFLLAQGDNWRRYWFKGSLIGAVFPTLILVLFSWAVYPTVIIISNWQKGSLLFWLISLAILKLIREGFVYLSIYSKDLMLKPMEEFMMLVLLFSAMFYLPERTNYMFTIIMLLLLLMRLRRNNEELNGKENKVNFDFAYVLASEEKRISGISRVLSMFIDVAQLQTPIKRKKAYDKLIDKLDELIGKDVSSYLSIRILIRNSSYSGIWLRLTVFFTLILSFTKQWWVFLMLGVSSIYLLIEQILPLWNKYKEHPMLLLYPNGNRVNKGVRSKQKIFTILSIGQLLIYSILLLFKVEFKFALLTVACWLFVLYIIRNIYLVRRS